MTGHLWWDEEDSEHIRSRSARYPGASDIEPAWTLEAAGDPHRLVRDPDPKSRAGYTRIVGYSPGAGFVVTVIVDPHDGSGVTAWKTSGGPARLSREQGDGIMTDTDDVRAARRARHAAIRAEVAQEEAEAAEVEAAENAIALDVPLHLRIDRQLDERLRQLAAADHIPTSALVRRLLRQATEHRAEPLTTADVEQIARRIAREEIDHT